MMQLDRFLYNLHFDIDKVRPVDLEVNWEDAPLPFKLYQGLPTVPLSLEIPVQLGREAGADVDVNAGAADADTGLKTIGNLLWYSYGITQLSHSMLPFAEGSDWQSTVAQLLRRYVPSGGGLYPNELYAYLKVEGLSPGVYHYDVAHHWLVLLREGNFDTYLERVLGHRCDMSTNFGMLFVSTMFWKNFYKYHNFAYRLQALDAGVLIGQIFEVAKQYGYLSRVYFEFLDQAVNRLIGLQDEEETVYAVVALTTADQVKSSSRTTLSPVVSPEPADTVCKELNELHHRHYMKSKNVTEYPAILEMNDASVRHSTDDFVPLRNSNTKQKSKPESYLNPEERGNLHLLAGSLSGEVVPLPDAQLPDIDLSTACRHRYSPGLDFVPERISLNELATLLRETMAATVYRNDLHDHDDDTVQPNILLGCCVHGFDGIPDGSYVYDFGAHTLRLRCSGDHRMRLQRGMSAPTVNLFQAPLCVHLIGWRDVQYHNLGYRGYRIEQMDAGIVLQRLLLAASALGMNGHPLLGYDVTESDEIYDLRQHGVTCLIEVPVGFSRKTSRFEGPFRR